MVWRRRMTGGKGTRVRHVLTCFYFQFQHLCLIIFNQSQQAMCVEDEGAMHMEDEGTEVLGGGRDEQGICGLRMLQTGTGGGDGARVSSVICLAVSCVFIFNILLFVSSIKHDRQ